MFRLILTFTILLSFAVNNICLPSCLADDKKDVNKDSVKQDQPQEKDNRTPEELKVFETKCSLVDAVDLVNDPKKYLDKYIFIKGQFDKYTTLGLDYKPAFKDSKDFITFLIRRPNVKSKNYIIPLSELKLIIPRKTAERYTSLTTGDDIIIYGKVFSTSLNDPWVEVDHLFSQTKDITAPPKDPELLQNEIEE